MAWIRGKLLGAGAFGSVNLAINREHGEVFAVKSVTVNENSEVAVRAIENEISLLQELESKYVVKCLGSDWSEEAGELKRNLFLEYMPEGCLTDFVKQFGASLDEHLLRTYTRSIVEGIDYLHRRGIVHCDIKGKNVLVGNGSVKLTDFGSAKRVTTECSGRNCALNGTPLWMAPEVAQQVEQGPASDIWSLGCTVVEMATGRAPWSNLAGMNPLVALYHIGCSDELPTVPSTLSADAHDFLSHCLQRDPSRRWTSAQLLQHPFLTTRFSPPASPVTVMEFPSQLSSDSSDEESFVNSVPTLAAPPASLFKRGLVSKAPKPLESENWWNTTPDSGPWIVVRSPKSSSSPPSFAVSDWTAPTTTTTTTTVSDSPLETTSIVATPEPSAIQIATSVDFCRFAISETVSGCVVFISESDLKFLNEEQASSTTTTTTNSSCRNARFNLGCAALIKNFNEYTESGYQFSDPRKILYWWYSHRKRLQRSHLGSEKPWIYVHSNHCIITLLDQHTLPLTLAKTPLRTFAFLLFLCRFLFRASFAFLLFLCWFLCRMLVFQRQERRLLLVELVNWSHMMECG